MVKSCRRYWSQEIADSIVQLKNIRFDNPMFSLTTTFNREDFTRLLIERVQGRPGGRHGLFRRRPRDEFLRRPADDDPRAVRRFFPGREDVIRLLMEPITYANGSTLEDPAISYGIVFSNFMSKGVFTFQGGTDRLIDLMEAELQNNGVDIRINCDVEQIDCNGGQRAGVDGQRPDDQARGAVMSNANLKQTIFRPRRRRELRQVSSSTTPGPCGSTTPARRSTWRSSRTSTIDESTGDLLFSSTAPAVSHRAAVEPRHHQPHVFVLLPADAARGPAAVPDRVEHERPLRGLGEA